MHSDVRVHVVLFIGMIFCLCWLRRNKKFRIFFGSTMQLYFQDISPFFISLILFFLYFRICINASPYDQFSRSDRPFHICRWRLCCRHKLFLFMRVYERGQEDCMMDIWRCRMRWCDKNSKRWAQEAWSLIRLIVWNAVISNDDISYAWALGKVFR